MLAIEVDLGLTYSCHSGDDGHSSNTKQHTQHAAFVF